MPNVNRNMQPRPSSNSVPFRVGNEFVNFTINMFMALFIRIYRMLNYATFSNMLKFFPKQFQNNPGGVGQSMSIYGYNMRKDTPFRNVAIHFFSNGRAETVTSTELIQALNDTKGVIDTLVKNLTENVVLTNPIDSMTKINTIPVVRLSKDNDGNYRPNVSGSARSLFKSLDSGNSNSNSSSKS